MSLVNPLSVEAVSAGRAPVIDEVAGRQRLFEWICARGAVPIDAQSVEAARQDRLAFWLSAQVHALYLDPPGTQAPPAFAHAPACAGHNRCRYCQQEFDLLHKRAALLVLGQSGLLEV
ncbi:pyoverdine biosynthesis protein [Pseudomonas protegens]|uniref:pyoverdine biosynthesis protein n=1 Tax=Pseudomonas protegens TaxID=380021 RepID=UPI000F484CFA|nr:pyoverdine biosynthesis protein [Pseudomonas protegens]ROL94037.1 pyoverdine biosynthesis protein [Pseudomonas protegens]ROL97132.1 pyoverdine biosynthesis protein [Pseudomonas protegens]ROM00207.1 pyoverdine biosynthesis protein [Pseudomonas protegens]ROM11043.1 pyoverdine biosynthesis protein [Pseudomonas protegens]